ncbi:MAG: ATP-binding protein [Saprospiraceae bacterium]|nr:ATP-binding protein [Saprospiraceae bacterium]
MAKKAKRNEPAPLTGPSGLPAGEMQWFADVLNTRLNLYFSLEAAAPDIYALLPPALPASDYRDLVEQYRLGFAERIALMLALMPHVNPRQLDVFFTKNATFDRPFTEFGGYSHPQHQGFLPTGETLAFLLAGADLQRRAEVFRLFSPGRPFQQFRLLSLEPGPENGPLLSGRLTLAPDLLYRLATGQEYRPEYSTQFPAHRIETRQEWTDLVLPEQTLVQIREIAEWIQYSPVLMDDWDMRRKLRPGFRCLFYGPPGTGKTMTACLLGKSTGRPVYRIDLSQVVSKYIGETEKNLARIFDLAEHKNWILFFDEADALFGKRTEIRDAHDRYANQEVSYLLQRIETFDGVALLASNQRDNLDAAFTRRFESMIYFPPPQAADRLRIWQQSIPERATLGAGVDLNLFARRYDLSGGSILNVVRFAALRAVANGGVMQLADLEEGVGREMAKEGRGS